MVTQQNFTLRVRWPNKACDHCVVRVRYVSNNPDEGNKDNLIAAFYQCADIQLIASEIETFKGEIRANDADIKLPSANYSCCTAKQFEARGREVLVSKGQTMEFAVYYDAINKFIRWDQWFFDSNLQFLFKWELFTNYNTLLEYIYDPATNSCELTGPDAIYEWCYGSTPEMKYLGKKKCEHQFQQCDHWEMDNGYEFWSIAESGNNCKPFKSRHANHHGVTNTMEYYFFKEGISDSHIFDLPVSCKH